MDPIELCAMHVYVKTTGWRCFKWKCPKKREKIWCRIWFISSISSPVSQTTTSNAVQCHRDKPDCLHSSSHSAVLKSLCNLQIYKTLKLNLWRWMWSLRKGVGGYNLGCSSTESKSAAGLCEREGGRSRWHGLQGVRVCSQLTLSPWVRLFSRGQTKDRDDTCRWAEVPGNRSTYGEGGGHS